MDIVGEFAEREFDFEHLDDSKEGKKKTYSMLILLI